MGAQESWARKSRLTRTGTVEILPKMALKFVPSGGSVGEFERLLDLEVRQTFDFEDAAGEDVLLALLLDG